MRTMPIYLVRINKINLEVFQPEWLVPFTSLQRDVV